MRTIHKYELEVTDKQFILMPKKSQILHVDVQRGNPLLWALVDTSLEKIKREVWIVGTGHPYYVPDGQKHVGTFMLLDGDFVGHVFA